jgi:hypothetical protein
MHFNRFECTVYPVTFPKFVLVIILPFIIPDRYSSLIFLLHIMINPTNAKLDRFSVLVVISWDHQLVAISILQ